MKIYVSVVDSQGKKQTFPLREKPIYIGRSKKSHVTITDDLASSQHLKIYLEDDCVYVEDLNSKNGILLNGVKVLKQRLYIDDKVKLGNTIIYFEGSKMDQDTILSLTSSDPGRTRAGELTLELETHKEKTQKLKKSRLNSSHTKDGVKNSKLYAGVNQNKDALEGKKGIKNLAFLEYMAILIDMAFSIIFFILPFIILKKMIPEKYNQIIKSDLGFKALIHEDALPLTGGSLLICFVVFKILRGLKKGSPGEKILKLD